MFWEGSAVVGPPDGAPGSLTQPRKQWHFCEQGPPAICWDIPIISPSPPCLVECLCQAVFHSQSSHPALYQCTLSPLANLVANSSLREASPLDSALLLLYLCGCLSNSKDFRAGVSSDLSSVQCSAESTRACKCFMTIISLPSMYYSTFLSPAEPHFVICCPLGLLLGRPDKTVTEIVHLKL